MLYSEGEVRARLEDFTTYFDRIATESSEAKAELLAGNQASEAEINRVTEENKEQAEQIRQLRSDIHDSREVNQKLATSLNDLQVRFRERNDTMRRLAPQLEKCNDENKEQVGRFTTPAGPAIPPAPAFGATL